ncbi:Mrp/NBP35 family ATP-binding protein [Mycetocola reblochoni]|uniref:Iron-sulfur cluster carrier protein n=1 Tax=Mycetocola reblochoni REB411 TaxID=1255698 RepID=A0A1R4J8I9_9MICO|nr:P-loop NTPase [Mycetocola reblochoni]SJN28367.1 Mrp protein homolog [Mycetocola reblochoni REB411]
MTDTRQPSDAELVERVTAALGTVIDPELRRPLPELGMVGEVTARDGAVTVEIRLTIVGCPAATTIERAVTSAVEGVVGEGNAVIQVGVMTPEQRTALTERLRGATRRMPFGPGSLTRVIAVTSGKGGVGKSTVTANLAAALASDGLNVGLVDADVHGFSIPGLLGLVDASGRATPPTRVGDMIVPPRAHGVAVISIGMFLEDPAAAVAWRGPMLHRTIEQFLGDVHFGDLDVLLIDLPPGTGDVAISLGQLLPNAEVVVVTTPQHAASDVAVRSGTVARQSGQTVVGVVETMSPVVLADGSTLELFGSGGGARVAERLSSASPGTEPVALLGSVPLSSVLREGGDTGSPVVLGAPADPAARALRAIAERLSRRGRGLSGRSLGLSPR